MNEADLRSIVRAAIQKQLGVQGPASVQMVPDSVPFGSHASHFMYLQLVNDNGGRCLIESKVPCNHCGYCQSHGH